MAANTKTCVQLAILCGLLQLAWLQGTLAETDAHEDGLEISDVIFIVMSQPNQYHVKRADALHKNFNNQLESLGIPITTITFLYLHKEWPGRGAWTIKPILQDIAAKYKTKKLAFFFEDETEINVDLLVQSLQAFDFNKELFLGNGLRDQEATIIHHFAFHENPGSFVYPDFAAGFILSMPLIKSVAARLEAKKPDPDFSIDAKHELAKYIWDDDKGVRLMEVPFLCTVEDSTNCATSYPKTMPDCGTRAPDVFIAVKTFHGFHAERLPVIKKTWGPTAKNMEIYSDVEDASIPTIDLGVPNTERGHCGKMMAIIKRYHKNEELSKFDWLAIVDDDTLISIPRLRRLLACYNPAEPVALGERYGYGVTAGYGYDYITGGGGMILSHSAVEQLVGSDLCYCPEDDSPDDMTLGMCLKRLGIPVTHSPLFHQARPADYSKGYLSHQEPISFHKHWMVDPVQVYSDWLYTEEHHDEL